MSENGRLYSVNPGTATMQYDKENRMQTHTLGETVTSFTYPPDRLKFTEDMGGRKLTTAVDENEMIEAPGRRTALKGNEN